MISASLVLLSAFQAPLEVPFRVSESAMLVDATVNGRKASFLFDTGFSGTVVMDASVNVGPAKGEMTLQDFVGTFNAKTVGLKSLSLGSVKIPVNDDMEIVQQPMNHISFGYNAHLDGIMGFQVIRNFVTEINFEKSRFILHPKSVDISQRKPDNKRTFLLKMLPTGRGSIELVAQTKEGKKMILALDTGNAFYATTHKDVLERVGLWKPGDKPKFMSLSGVASGPVQSFYKRMEDVAIYGVPVPSAVWSIIDLPASSAEGDGTIGFGFLKNFNIIIDYDRRRVWLDNFSGKVSSEEPGGIGVSASTNERTGRVEIYLVSEDSPAAKAGLKKGDQILSIDGKDAPKGAFRELDQMLDGPVGSKVQLAISRGGNLVRFEVERAALVN
jgi:hypothetical protein